MERARPRVVIVSDLDGTLLDHATYAADPASPVVARLVAEDVPLVLCSSKTRAEIEAIRNLLRIRHPFIVENGGALFLPAGYFTFPIDGTREADGYQVVELGLPYRQVVAGLLEASARLGVRVAGFHGMSAAEVARETGLSPEQARAAKDRRYDEPFRLAVDDSDGEARLCGSLEAAGLRCVRGGRFFHVTGAADKGTAVTALAQLYRRVHEDVVTVGLGDGMNDLSLLGAVDVPIIVRNRAADPAGDLIRSLPEARVSDLEGPAGWAAAVRAVLEAPDQLAAGAARRQP